MFDQGLRGYVDLRRLRHAREELLREQNRLSGSKKMVDLAIADGIAGIEICMRKFDTRVVNHALHKWNELTTECRDRFCTFISPMISLYGM